MLAVGIIIAVLGGYLLGSIPTGYLVAKARGIDIRAAGSGNIGATNVFRILGTPAGIFVLLADASKGWLAVFLAAKLLSPLLPHWFERPVEGSWDTWFAVSAAIAAVLGHNYTVWLRFKGGKGIATSAGVLIGLVPMAVGIALVVWVVIFILTRYVSLASISGAFVLPFAVWYTGYERTMIIVTAFMAALAIYKHRSNIDRLLKGTENRIGRKKPAEGGPK